MTKLKRPSPRLRPPAFRPSDAHQRVPVVSAATYEPHCQDCDRPLAPHALHVEYVVENDVDGSLTLWLCFDCVFSTPDALDRYGAISTLWNLGATLGWGWIWVSA